jgi:hypothetical protein
MEMLIYDGTYIQFQQNPVMNGHKLKKHSNIPTGYLVYDKACKTSFHKLVTMSHAVSAK